MMTTTYTQFRKINDIGHGWLQVPKCLVYELGIENKITAYSYETEKYIYLEEDCDMHIFFQTYFDNENYTEARAFWDFYEHIPRVYLSTESEIRNYNRFGVQV